MASTETNNRRQRLRALHTVAEVFEVLGGVHGVVEISGCKYKACLNWKQQYVNFPCRTYLILQNELKRRGYIADPKLWKML